MSSPIARALIGKSEGDEALRAIYREIMSAAIALEKPLLVAYLGPEASNTHAAAMKKFGASVDYHPMATVADIAARLADAAPAGPVLVMIGRALAEAATAVENGPRISDDETMAASAR